MQWRTLNGGRDFLVIRVIEEVEGQNPLPWVGDEESGSGQCNKAMAIEYSVEEGDLHQVKAPFIFMSKPFGGIHKKIIKILLIIRSIGDPSFVSDQYLIYPHGECNFILPAL